eukprot:CAMPEP_0196811134 /NCGR_PEP_ID=MMETSP1362-20130617/16973_1 /TAXON_ID=163516 /ORGANISM="Leptocylindrus danicus, Strain CCMP1856" /LENGTH=110 /DNA_ID=CAMNT_0042186393 /DNA_START=82 /DNA_END=410 /DNA_ORIENTATION=+
MDTSKKQEKTQNQNDVNEEEDEYNEHIYRTRLHAECNTRKLDADRLRKILHNDPDAAFIRAPNLDNILPIHVLLKRTKKILRDEELFDFCIELICTNPSALLEKETPEEG